MRRAWKARGRRIHAIAVEMPTGTRKSVNYNSVVEMEMHIQGRKCGNMKDELK